jgi:hypothetical protein
MTIDPKTTVGQLITALPSTMPLLQGYGISPQQSSDKSLCEVLTDVHVDLEEFLQALNEIDWNAELS